MTRDFDDDRNRNPNREEDRNEDRELSELLAALVPPAPSEHFVEDVLCSRLLEAHETPEPSADFVDDVLLRRVLHAEAAETPAPSAEFVDDVLLRRQLATADTPAPSAGFVDRVTTALLSYGPVLSHEPGLSDGPVLSDEPVLADEPARAGRSPLRFWVASALVAAALVLALLPLLFPGGAPFKPMDEIAAQRAFAASLEPGEFASEATNPAARTAALLQSDARGPSGGRLAFAMPRTYETADDAALGSDSLPFELGFELPTEDD